MAKWATGKRSQSISDRSGMAFPYSEMVKEWNGSLVHYSEFEPKHPQIRRKHFTADAIALQNTRGMKFLPGSFAFRTQDFNIIRNGVTTVMHSMIPEDPALQNRRRQLISSLGKIEVSIT